MNVYVQELRSDHQRLQLLLNFARENLPSERPGRRSEEIRPLRQCIEYIRAYSIDIHQSREDVLFQQLARRYEGAKVYVDVLYAEHRLLTHNAEELYQTAVLVEKGRDAYRSLLARSARDFINTKIRHMRLEEDTVFPLLESRLTLEDWKHVIADIPSHRDPLFDDERNDTFAPLRSLVEDHSRRASANGS